MDVAKLVERLREWPTEDDMREGKYTKAGFLLEQAADALERMEKKIAETIKQSDAVCDSYATENQQFSDTIDALRADLEKEKYYSAEDIAKQIERTGSDIFDDENAMNTARNKALEEVLRLIESSYSMNPEKDKPLFELGIKVQRLMLKNKIVDWNVYNGSPVPVYKEDE